MRDCVDSHCVIADKCILSSKEKPSVVCCKKPPVKYTIRLKRSAGCQIKKACKEVDMIAPLKRAFTIVYSEKNDILFYPLDALRCDYCTSFNASSNITRIET
jgi:hypothetical protein